MRAKDLSGFGPVGTNGGPDSVGKVVAEMRENFDAAPNEVFPASQVRDWMTRLQALDRQRQEGERRDDAVVIPLHLYDEINATGAAWKERAEAAEAALREAGRDAERLDWLDGFAASSHFTISEYFGRAGKDRYVEIQDEDDAVISEAPTLRESIDKAMAWWEIKLREDAALNGGQDDA